MDHGVLAAAVEVTQVAEWAWVARPTDQQGGATPLVISAEEHLCHDSPLINLRLRSSSQRVCTT